MEYIIPLIDDIKREVRDNGYDSERVLNVLASYDVDQIQKLHDEMFGVKQEKGPDLFKGEKEHSSELTATENTDKSNMPDLSNQFNKVNNLLNTIFDQLNERLMYITQLIESMNQRIDLLDRFNLLDNRVEPVEQVEQVEQVEPNSTDTDTSDTSDVSNNSELDSSNLFDKPLTHFVPSLQSQNQFPKVQTIPHIAGQIWIHQ